MRAAKIEPRCFTASGRGRKLKTPAQKATREHLGASSGLPFLSALFT